MMKCNTCSFNCSGKCLVATGIKLEMNTGKRSDYISYANSKPCDSYKEYTTRLRDINTK